MPRSSESILLKTPGSIYRRLKHFLERPILYSIMTRTAFMLLTALAMAGALFAGEADDLYKTALEQDDARALQTLFRARKLAPKDARIHYRIGYLYHKMNRRPEARQSYEETIALKPCHTRALNNVGNILYDQGERERAVAVYRQAIQCDADFFSAHYNLANLYRKEDKLQDAERHYLKAISSHSDHYRSHHNLGLIYLRRAKDHLDDGASPEEVRKNEDFRKALQHFDRACKLNVRDPLNFYNRGRAHALAQDYQRAVSDYKRSLSLIKRESAFKNRLRKKIQVLEVKGR